MVFNCQIVLVIPGGSWNCQADSVSLWLFSIAFSTHTFKTSLTCCGDQCRYLTGFCERPLSAADLATASRAVLAPWLRRVAAGGTCSCHWAGSASGPRRVFLRSAGCCWTAPRNRAAVSGVRRKEYQWNLGYGCSFC